MPAVIIISAIVLLLLGLSVVKASLVIDYSENLCVFLEILFVKIRLYPKKEKKPIQKLSKRKLERLEKIKNGKKADSSSQNDEKPKSETEKKVVKKKDEPSLLDNLNTVRNILSAVLPKFARYLSVRISRMRVVVATDDAAKTAILYGAVSQVVAYILEILDYKTNLSCGNDVSVSVDYLSDKPSVDMNIVLSLRVYQAVSLFFTFLTSKNKK